MEGQWRDNGGRMEGAAGGPRYVLGRSSLDRGVFGQAAAASADDLTRPSPSGYVLTCATGVTELEHFPRNER